MTFSGREMPIIFTKLDFTKIRFFEHTIFPGPEMLIVLTKLDLTRIVTFSLKNE